MNNAIAEFNLLDYPGYTKNEIKKRLSATYRFISYSGKTRKFYCKNYSIKLRIFNTNN